MPINRIAHSSTEIDIQNYINILRAGQSVSDTGWSLYADSAGVNPVDGIGGTANITWSQNSTSPLSGEVDLRLVKDASNRQGQGVSIPFTIENRHLGKVLQITFDTELISGNYESPIITSTTGTYSITSTTCTVTANHSFVQGQVVDMTFTSGTVPPNGTYVITSVTATTFVFTVASGSGTGNCSYTVPADLRVSIIQDPTGTPVVIEPVNTGIALGIVNQRIRHIATFQTHLSLRNYRLCIHVANASTVAYTVDFANFKVWEPQQSVGAVITDWQSYTPTFAGIGTSASLTAIDFRWQRVGKNLKIIGRCTITTAATGSGVFTFTLPTGLVPDLGYTSGDGVFVGTLIRGVISESNVFTLLARNDNLIRIGANVSMSSPSHNPLVGSNATTWFGDGNILNLMLEVPIAGWGSSVAMSSDTGDSRVVAARYTNQTTSGTILVYQTRDYDTHSAYNATTGVFTAPISGQYRFSAITRANAGSQFAVQIDGSTYTNAILDIISTGYASTITDTVFLRAGQQLRIVLGVGVLSGTITSHSFSIERISAGSQVIASVEGVGCRYTSTSGQTIITDTVILFGTRENDTHNAYNSTTGLFTAPMSGWYQIRANVVLNTNTLTFLDIQRDSSTRLVYLSYPSNRGSISTVVYLLGGQTLRVRASANTSTALSNAVGDNSLDIVRIGI